MEHFSWLQFQWTADRPLPNLQQEYSSVELQTIQRAFIFLSMLDILRADVDIHFDLDVNANLCIGRTGTEVSGALGALTPTVGVTVSGQL